MDPLSDIVSRLKISSQKIVTFGMSANTKALFPDYSGMKIYIGKSGAFFIKMAGDVNIYLIEQGDVLILSRGREFSIFDNPNAPTNDIRKTQVMKDRSSCFTNGGCDFSFVGLPLRVSEQRYLPFYHQPSRTHSDQNATRGKRWH